MWQDWDLGGIPGQAGVVKTCSGDVALRQTLIRMSASSYSNENHLLVAHALRGFKPVNPDPTEKRGENLTAFGQTVAEDDGYQYATGFQPAIGMAQEQLLCAATVSRSQRPIVRGIQIQESEALDRALHFQRIALDNVGNPLAWSAR
jgi:hypothetical protein